MGCTIGLKPVRTIWKKYLRSKTRIDMIKWGIKWLPLEILRRNQFRQHIEALQYIHTVRILDVRDVLKLLVSMPKIWAFGQPLVESKIQSILTPQQGLTFQLI